MNTIAILSLIALIVVCLTIIHQRRLRQAGHKLLFRLVQSLHDGKSLKDRVRSGKG